MNGNDKNNFFYLNRDNRWPGFHLNNVEINPQGELQLRAVPRAIRVLPENLASLLPPDLPAGIAAAADGTIFLSDSENHQIWRVDPCDEKGIPQVVRCLGSEGFLPTQFRAPRGLFIHQKRHALMVADTGNHRVQIFDLSSLQMLDIWGDRGDTGEPQPGLCDEPIALAGDVKGNIYVLSRKGKLLQKFNRFGQVEAEFWTAVESSGRLTNPVALAVAKSGHAETVFVLDHKLAPVEEAQVLEFDISGAFIHAVTLQNAERPLAMVVTASAIYLGDNGRLGVVQYDLDGSEVGAAVGFHGPVAALTADHRGNLLVHTGEARHPVWLAGEAGYLTAGDFWSGPLEVGQYEVVWHRLQTWAAPLPAESHIQFYLMTEKSEPGEDPATLFTPQHERPIDVLDLLIQEPKARHLYLGARLSGDGTGSPRLSQMQVSYDHETYLHHLPAIYQNDEAGRAFLSAALSLFESFFEEGERKIRELPALFDPYAAPRGFLPWLAGWLALEIDENWSEALARRTIAEAFAACGWRGTARGLRQSLESFAGIRTHILEPILHLHVWSLGETSTLGFDTMLASAHAQGAVVGTTATLDQSHLITNEEFGAPLFESVAHQFAVHVYRGEVNTAEKEEKVRSLIGREKPAHSDYHLCVIEPRMRVGLQSRVGIDTVVAGPPEVLRLNEELRKRSSLSGIPAGRIGERSQIGVSTRVY
ncbi:MAG: phage tail protein I [candidate division KSB1 bacterium]|nr:phage tail protein I [candidate division KSB1 bacterium]MDZ7273976.1 phage tail protein I [candidate division KSB1 bacterium]MDZ7286349.1 phage tail protein I [candidate division KSB1 bacterium]MDZ7296577.1 phage tail protein I [candidate division KSB1 bacterium]MDZ7306110.1 phage tail protein I [candidate division KSB1 bacterium]